MRIQHNIMAMNAYNQYNKNTKALSANLEKLSSGYKINRAGDDAAGLAISEKMRAQITGLDAAQKNVKDGISLVKTAEGAMQEIHDMLNKMEYLATQSANGTYQDEVDRENLQKEVDSLKAEIDRIAESSNFNGIKLLDGSLSSKATTSKIEVTGANSVKSAGTKSTFQNATAFSDYGAAGTEAEDGDVLSFNIGFKDGTSKTVQIKVDMSDGTGKHKLTSVDGKTTYGTLATDGVVTNNELGAAVESALKATDLAEEFDISYTPDNGGGTDPEGKLTLTAVNEGTGGREVGSFDMTVAAADGTQKYYGADPSDDTAATIFGVDATLGIDEGREIDANTITEYDGTNADEAIFTINGKKFVVLANELNPSINGTGNEKYLQATAGLGSDVNILVGGIGGLKDGGKGTTPSTSDDIGGTPLTQTDLDNAVTTAQTDKTTADTALTTAETNQATAQTAHDTAWATAQGLGATDKAVWEAGAGATSKATLDAANTALAAAQADATAAQTALDNALAAQAAGPQPVTDFANDNFQQNIKKIAEVTGLKVTGTVSNDGNDIDANFGIRLSKGEGTDGGLTLQIGDTADSYNQMKVSVGDMHTKAMGIDGVDISTQAGAQAAIQTVKDAINYVSSVRGDLGAIQNRLDHTGNNLAVMQENIQDAESTIRDTDVAQEMMAYVKNNILVQSAQAMLAQANQVPQGVLQLLG